MGRGEQIISMHTRRDGIIAGQRRTSAALESIFTPLITISNVSSACVVTVVDADVVAELVAELVAVLEEVVASGTPQEMTGSLNWTAIPCTKLPWFCLHVQTVGSGVRWDAVSPWQVSTLPYRYLTWRKRCGKLCGRETKGCARCVFVGVFVGCACVRVRVDACARVSQTWVVCVHDHNIDPQQRQERWSK